MGDAVIDDVSFLDCSPALPSDQPCTQEQYACANGHCIPQDNLCDFINHCGDNSDEDPYICSEASSNVLTNNSRLMDAWIDFFLLPSFRGL